MHCRGAELFLVFSFLCKSTLSRHRRRRRCSHPPPTPSPPTGLVKKYRIPVIDDENLSLEMDRRAFPVNVAGKPATLTKWLSSFHSGVAEVAITAHPQTAATARKNVQIRSHLDPRKGTLLRDCRPGCAQRGWLVWAPPAPCSLGLCTSAPSLCRPERGIHPHSAHTRRGPSFFCLQKLLWCVLWRWAAAFA